MLTFQTVTETPEKLAFYIKNLKGAIARDNYILENNQRRMTNSEVRGMIESKERSERVLARYEDQLANLTK